MFTFKDTSMTDLFQWSIGVIIVFSDENLVGEKVHFSNDKKKAISRTIDQNLEVEIPNCLLQKAFPIEVYTYVKNESGFFTKDRKIIRVLARPKPDSYICDDEEIETWETKVDIFQGKENANKILGVNEEGNVVPMGAEEIAEKLSDKSFIFTQNSASDTWNIEHNLSKFPSITVVDSAHNVIVGDYRYLDKNSVEAKFSSAFSGIAYLN